MPGIRLVVNNSNSLIEGLTVAQSKSLRLMLSYNLDPKQQYYAGSFGPARRYLIDKKGNFPTGLLYLVRDWLTKARETYKYLDNRIPPKSSESLFNLSLPITPYPEQTNAVAACFRSNRGIISAVTGFGKSVTMALLIQKLQVRTLIVVPNLELKRQLTEAFVGYFGKLTNITIENIDSPKLDKLTNYDCLIIDEAHHAAAKTYRDLNKKAWNGIFYRFFFTATPFRSRDEEQILFESVAGRIIYEIDYHAAVSKGYIAPVEAFYIEIPKIKIKGTNWPSVYSELVVNNEVRNDILSNILVKFMQNNMSTLCLVKEIKHGDILKEKTNGLFANGQNEDTEYLIRLFNERKLNVLIGTTGVLGEGIDTRPCEYIIIAGLGKSKNSFMQSVGRGLRKYPGKESCKVIIILDRSHKWSVAHYKEQCKILLEEYSVVPTRLDVDIS